VFFLNSETCNRVLHCTQAEAEFTFFENVSSGNEKNHLSYIILPPPQAFWIVSIPYSHLLLEKLKESEMEDFQITFSFLSIIQEDVSEIALAGTLPALSLLNVTCSVAQRF
jgi:hypothetical protein